MLKDSVLEYNDGKFAVSPGVTQIGIQSCKSKPGFLKMLKTAR